jgi:multisubunit Na+/H+ antiporter MnhF subunit
MPGPNPARAKETVLVITVGFMVLYLVFRSKVFIDIALVIGVVGILSNYLSERIDWVWSKLSTILAVLSNTLLLTLVFVLVLTPMAVVRRLRRKDAMTRFDPAATSNFVTRDHTFVSKDLEQTW